MPTSLILTKGEQRRIWVAYLTDPASRKAEGDLMVYLPTLLILPLGREGYNGLVAYLTDPASRKAKPPCMKKIMIAITGQTKIMIMI